MAETSDQTWRVTLAWKGTNYSGWQIQLNAPTIQACVETALGTMCGLDGPVAAQASGRTDSGVHAEMQVVGFTLPVERTAQQVVAGLNHHTPDDIVCLSAVPVETGFSPRRWTKAKLYRYRILNRIPRCPFRDDYVWHVQKPVEVESIKAAIPHLAGQHDYSSFRAAGCSATSTVRQIEHARVYRADSDEIVIEFEGHGFLRHQVRIMVGTLVEVGLGKRSPEDVLSIRESCDRSVSGQTAPAKGLTLVRVDLLTRPRQYNDDQGV